MSAAQILIQNGLGYDDFMTDLASASPNDGPEGHQCPKGARPPDDTANPHLCTTRPRCRPWLRPSRRISRLSTRHMPALPRQHAKFTASLKPWDGRSCVVPAAARWHAIAVTEAVADYMLEAGGPQLPRDAPVGALRTTRSGSRC